MQIQALQQTEIYFLAGATAYVLIHLVFRWEFLHVMSHEVTHWLFTLCFGGKITELHVTERYGGKVIVNRANFLISLSPYFFPLFAVIVLLIGLLIKSEFQIYAAFLTGFFLSFHILFTINSIGRGQPDIYQHGSFFSCVFIVFANVLIIAAVFSVVSRQFRYIAFLKDAYNILAGLIGLQNA